MAISRRSFLKNSAAVTAFSMAGKAVQSVFAESMSASFSPGPGNKWPGKVVVNFNKNAVTGAVTIGDDQVAVIKKMVDDSIMALAEKATVGEAWKAIFPDTLTKDSKIAIKTNFYPTSACRVHWSVVQAMTEGLQQMDFSGTPFPAANITVFEGNVPAANTMDGAGYTAARFPGINRVIATFDKNVSDAATGEKNGYATPLKNADFFMNVFGLRGHSNAYAEGVTLGGKSHYGTYSNIKPAHTSPALSIRCANMMGSGAVYKKLVLSVCAGLLSNKKGSGINDAPTDYSTYAKKMDPTCTTKATSTIIMSTDPVSTDMQAIKVMQMNTDGSYGVADMPKYVQALAGNSGALSGVSYNIGIIDENDMSVLKIINGDVITPVQKAERKHPGGAMYSMRVSPCVNSGIVHIEYTVPALRLGEFGSVAVFDVSGNLLFTKKVRIQGVLNQFSWDRRTDRGNILGAGNYVCQLKIGSVRRSTGFVIM